MKPAEILAGWPAWAALLVAVLGKRMNFYGTLSFTVIGGILYYAVVVIVLWLKLNSNDLKLFTAIIVAVI